MSMAQRKAAILQSELTRYLRAHRDAGIPITRTEIDPRTGRVIIFSSSETPIEGALNDWDDA